MISNINFRLKLLLRTVLCQRMVNTPNNTMCVHLSTSGILRFGRSLPGMKQRKKMSKVHSMAMDFAYVVKILFCFSAEGCIIRLSKLCKLQHPSVHQHLQCCQQSFSPSSLHHTDLNLHFQERHPNQD